MGEVSVSQLKARLSEYLNRTAYGHERITVTSRGKPKAAIVGIQDLELLEEFKDAEAARQALREHEAGETIPLAQPETKLHKASEAPPS